jgi:hypothetical protein
MALRSSRDNFSAIFDGDVGSEEDEDDEVISEDNSGGGSLSAPSLAAANAAVADVAAMASALSRQVQIGNSQYIGNAQYIGNSQYISDESIADTRPRRFTLDGDDDDDDDDDEPGGIHASYVTPPAPLMPESKSAPSGTSFGEVSTRPRGFSLEAPIEPEMTSQHQQQQGQHRQQQGQSNEQEPYGRVQGRARGFTLD